MTTILEILFIIDFAVCGISILLSLFIHGVFIRPVALQLRNNKNILSRFIWFSGSDLADYWDVETVAKKNNDQQLFKKLKFFRYCFYTAAASFVLGFMLFFAELILSLVHNSGRL
jgi:magnesium-transporting ATPase (P-type)